MAAEALRAAAAAAVPVQRPQDLVGLWLVALAWPGDGRWGACGPAAPSEHVHTLLAALRAHVTALRVASAAALPGACQLAESAHHVAPSILWSSTSRCKCCFGCLHVPSVGGGSVLGMGGRVAGAWKVKAKIRRINMGYGAFHSRRVLSVHTGRPSS